VAFDPALDRLWLVGDLVNRGPQSLETLRFLYSLRESLVCVLGNHDLHLLAAWQNIERLKKNDTLREIIEAPDCAELMLDWLRQQKLMHYDEQRDIAMAHAGHSAAVVAAQSTASCAEEVETALRDDNLFEAFLDGMYGNEPAKWDNDLKGVHPAAGRSPTISRACVSAPPKASSTSRARKASTLRHHRVTSPWFQHKERKTKGLRIIFGHWAALEGQCTEPGHLRARHRMRLGRQP
jgi:bis(5'-nucleosyl)-tetraphosphatase (symmetrical)